MTIHQHSGRISPSPGSQPTQNDPSTDAPARDTDGASFEDHLKEASKEAEDIELSSHAKQRIAQRNISLDTAERQALTDAVETLDAKGAQDAAVLRDDAAFVVNVPNRTVVTALDQSEMQKRVFTQIDSAMKL
jgi:flagellar operon protein